MLNFWNARQPRPKAIGCIKKINMVSRCGESIDIKTPLGGWRETVSVRTIFGLAYIDQTISKRCHVQTESIDVSRDDLVRLNCWVDC